MQSTQTLINLVESCRVSYFIFRLLRGLIRIDFRFISHLRIACMQVLITIFDWYALDDNHMVLRMVHQLGLFFELFIAVHNRALI